MGILEEMMTLYTTIAIIMKSMTPKIMKTSMNKAANTTQKNKLTIMVMTKMTKKNRNTSGKAPKTLIGGEETKKRMGT